MSNFFVALQNSSTTSSVTVSTDNKNNSTVSSSASSSNNYRTSITVSTASVAETKLSQYLGIENNTDISFNDYGGILNSDTDGRFYKITLISKSAQKVGGAGTYKVYQNGKIVSLK